ncbi:hypothetical protein EU527_04420 [Candidatus Thorarchaeota archaeon]|nr:MAG: hypothetical protein EU527_04420 [Candidatus Thorarchaeota archaeon]
MNNPFSIKFEIGSPDTSIMVVLIKDLILGKSTKEFEEYEQSVFKEIRAKNNLEDLRHDTLLQSYRAMHWAYGIDPTKKRGSSEAVLRRVLQGENLWRISDLVDIVNLASAYHKIPIGLIDADKLEGQLTLRNAREGEIFQRIGGESIECRGREIVLADDVGIVCYGYAIHDSDRTKVTLASKRVLLLHYGSNAVTKEILTQATNYTLRLIKKWVECKHHEPIRFGSSI